LAATDATVIAPDLFVAEHVAPGLKVAFTGRGRRPQTGPYDGFNLGSHVGDDPDVVRDNRSRLAGWFGVPDDHLLFMEQEHGDTVLQVAGPWPGEPAACDAMVTTATDVALAVMVADCVPVLLADPANGVLGVAHAGRKGMEAAIVVRLFEAMKDLGAVRVLGWLGPSVCPRCYPVPAGLCERVADRWPVTRSVSWSAEPALDVAAGVLAQLAPLCHQVRQTPGCTVERGDLYSFRRDGETGRSAGVARLGPGGPEEGVLGR
jgi:polyphenol oxidase